MPPPASGRPRGEARRAPGRREGQRRSGSRAAGALGLPDRRRRRQRDRRRRGGRRSQRRHLRPRLRRNLQLAGARAALRLRRWRRRRAGGDGNARSRSLRRGGAGQGFRPPGARGVRVGAVAEGEPAPGPPEEIVLRPAEPARGKVVDERDQGMAGAELRLKLRDPGERGRSFGRGSAVAPGRHQRRPRRVRLHRGGQRAALRPGRRERGLRRGAPLRRLPGRRRAAAAQDEPRRPVARQGHQPRQAAGGHPAAGRARRFRRRPGEPPGAVSSSAGVRTRAATTRSKVWFRAATG